MKTIYRIIIAAATIVAAAACASVEEVLPADRQSVGSGQGDNAPVTFSASVGVNSKTSIDEDRKVSWTTGDKIMVFDAEGRSEAFTVEEDCDSYSFTSRGTLGDGPYYAVAGYGEDTPTFDKDTRKIAIARTSSTTDGSFGGADLIASTTSGTSFTFHHVFTLLKMSLGSDDITSLTFSAKGIASSGNTLVGFDASGAVVAEYDNGGDEVTINDIPGHGTYFMAINPGYYDEGFTFYLQKGNARMKITSDKAFTASVDRILNFGTLDGGTPAYSAWELVTDAGCLSIGDEIIIAASGYNYAMSTTQNNNNRGAASIVKSYDKSILEEPGDDVQVITLTAGAKSGTFGLSTGSGYLYAASSSKNYLKTQTSLDVNGSWKITISSGTASIAAQGTATRSILRFNTNNGTPIFSCYGTGQMDIAIYKRVSTPGEGPQMNEINAFLEETIPGVYSYDAENDVATPLYQYTAGRDQFSVSAGAFRLQDLSDGHLAGVTLPVSTVIAGNRYSASLMLFGIEGYPDGSCERMLLVKKSEFGKAWLLEENGAFGFIINTK